MSLKRQLLDAIKKDTPEFDETNDYFIIEFEGGGDSFISFSHCEIENSKGEVLESDFNPDEHYELIMEIMDKSGVEYTFLDYGSFCKMSYGGGEINIDTKSPLSFDDSDYSKAWQDDWDDEDEARDAYYDDMEIKFDEATFND